MDEARRIATVYDRFVSEENNIETLIEMYLNKVLHEFAKTQIRELIGRLIESKSYKLLSIIDNRLYEYGHDLVEISSDYEMFKINNLKRVERIMKVIERVDAGRMCTQLNIKVR